jgi:CHASE3 domain sensor protein
MCRLFPSLVEAPMSRFQLSVRARLAALLAFTNIFLIAAAAYSWYSISRLNAQLQAVIATEHQVQSVNDLARKAQLDFKVQVQEWKDMLLRGQDYSLFQHHSSAFAERSEAVRGDLAAIAKAAPELGLPDTIEDVAMAQHADLDRKYAEAIKLYRNDDFSSAQLVDRAVKGIDRGPTDEFDRISKQVRERGEAIAEQAIRDAAAEKRFLVAGLAILAFVTIAMSALLGAT